MSALTAFIGTIGIIGALALLGECMRELPTILRARAEADVIRRTQRRYSPAELHAALIAAIRRTDPDVGDELAHRLALTVIEDLHAGTVRTREGFPVR